MKIFGATRPCASMAAAVGVCVAVTLTSVGAFAQSQGGRDQGRYVPTIWVDPDGCEHWVMDDGAEGYMTPHVRRDGRPVCNRGNTCAIVDSDQLFAVDSHKISASGRERLRQVFSQSASSSFVIAGHTDSTASDAYNLRLSERRANAVAQIARSVGASVAEIRGYGERVPVASNATREGRALNRRVEITCL